MTCPHCLRCMHPRYGPKVMVNGKQVHPQCAKDMRRVVLAEKLAMLRKMKEKAA